jgi:AraC family transcriptional regulator
VLCLYLGMSTKSKSVKLLIKNMVCQRCVMSVENILKTQQVPYSKVSLGEVDLERELNPTETKNIEAELKQVGFELITGRTNKIVEDIKQLVMEYIGLGDDKKSKLSSFITAKLHYDYSYLSDLFSSIEGITIEQYLIVQRIEKVKELLVYDQLSLTEIAFQVGFSSVHHLSAQFKKVTGLTPTHFKKIGSEKRRALDRLT